MRGRVIRTGGFALRTESQIESRRLIASLRDFGMIVEQAFVYRTEFLDVERTVIDPPLA